MVGHDVTHWRKKQVCGTGGVGNVLMGVVYAGKESAQLSVHHLFALQPTETPSSLSPLPHRPQYDTWTSTLQERQVIISTPQMLFNLLNKGAFTFERINLLIFDECHSCGNKHPVRKGI